MQIARFASPLGTCIDDIDVRTFDVPGIASLNTAFPDHHGLVFPGQNLTPQEQAVEPGETP